MIAVVATATMMPSVRRIRSAASKMPISASVKRIGSRSSGARVVDSVTSRLTANGRARLRSMCGRPESSCGGAPRNIMAMNSTAVLAWNSTREMKADSTPMPCMSIRTSATRLATRVRKVVQVM